MSNNQDKKVNEPGGRLFEFITKCVLKVIFPGYTIEWQPKGIDKVVIQPDIAIYDDKSNLLSIGFCAHATAYNAAGMKVERSVEELFEVKETHENVLAISFIWHSPNGWAPGQLRTMDAIFDYNFVAYRDCKKIWDELWNLMVSLTPKVKGKKDHECEELVAKSGIVELLLPYLSSLQKLVGAGKEKNEKLWRLIRREFKDNKIEKGVRLVDQPIKAGLLPLVWVSENDTEKMLTRSSVRYSDELEAFVRLGGGRRFDLTIFRSSSVAYLCNRYPRTLVLTTLRKLKAAEGVSTLVNTMASKTALERRISRIAQAVKSNTLFKLCRDAEKKSDQDYTGNSWVLSICTEWIKLKVDQKFGLFEAQREALGDQNDRFRSEFTVISYIDGDFCVFADAELEKLCIYISQLLKKAKLITVKELSRSLKTEALKKKKFNPLHWLVSETLSDAGLDHFKPEPMFAIFSNGPCPGNVGSTSFQHAVKIGLKVAVVHVLSTYSTTHKDVEFSAKMRLLRHEKKGKNFSLRDGYEFYYVLDGKWPKRTVAMLERAGAIVVLISDLPTLAQKLKQRVDRNTKEGGLLPPILPKYGAGGDEDVEYREVATPQGKKSKSATVKKIPPHK